jgi:hypothetical protein
MMRLVLVLFLALMAGGAPVWGQIRFHETTLGRGLKGGYQVIAADLNKDGKPDLIALASGMPELVWFENPSWERGAGVAGGACV